MSIFGQPTFVPLNIDSSNFNNPIQVMDEQNVLHGNQLEQIDTDTDNDDKQTQDVIFEIADQDSHINHNIFHVPCREMRLIRNAPLTKYLEQFQF